MSRKRMAILSATGTGQKRTLPAVMEYDICDIVGIHGRSAEKVAQVAQKFSIPFHTTSAADLLDSVRPDFVFIGSPPFLHLEQIRMCADRRIPVLCEKPLCVTVGDAQSIEEAVRSARIVARVAHHLRHQPGIQFIRETIQGGALGIPRRASIQWAFWVREEASSNQWKLDPAKGGAHAFFDSGIHAIDLMLHIFPPPRIVAAIASKSRFPDSFSTVSALFDCGDTIAEVSTSQATRFPVNAITIDCEGGTLHAPHALGEQPFRRLEITTASGTEVKTFDPRNPYGEEVADFVRLLDGAPSCATTLSEATRGVEILNAIAESLRNARAVEL